ncbi:hypothetical protein [Methanococcus maripaludis]|uniref:Uncharacterized protein n=1 Tax=Methanococcus maripaludis TaxID=39152 RepID=A0A8T4CL80_METMI|nr:hypothetical protein [Methanococcus maripaludis]MBM7408752.1 hypothetical protein [Methanococcus maripaludis]MBP2219079.1 hypothetical protein [Methanococcus maripaludis]
MSDEMINYELAAKLYNGKYNEKFSANTVNIQVFEQEEVCKSLNAPFNEKKELAAWLNGFGLLEEYQNEIGKVVTPKSEIKSEKLKIKNNGETLAEDKTQNKKIPASLPELLTEVNQKISTLTAGRKKMKFEDFKDMRLHLGDFEIVSYHDDIEDKDVRFVNFTVKGEWEHYCSVGSEIVVGRFSELQKGLESNPEVRDEFENKGIIAVLTEKESKKKKRIYQTCIFMPVSEDGANIPPIPEFSAEA